MFELYRVPGVRYNIYLYQNLWGFYSLLKIQIIAFVTGDATVKMTEKKVPYFEELTLQQGDKH